MDALGPLKPLYGKHSHVVLLVRCSQKGLCQCLPDNPLCAGGGFVPAFTQLCAFYYLVGALLHFCVPLFFPVQNVQQQPRKQGAVARDAFFSIGRHACV